MEPELPYKGAIQDLWILVTTNKENLETLTLVRGETGSPFPVMTDDAKFLPQIHAIGMHKVDTGDALSYSVVHFTKPTIAELP